MNRRLVAPCVALIASALVAPSPVMAAPQPAAPDRVPGEVLVGYREDTPAAARTAARARVGGRVAFAPRRDLELVRLPARVPIHAAIAALTADPGVAYAEPNLLVRAHATTPDDPVFGDQWGLHNIRQWGFGLEDADVDAPSAWDVRTDAPSIILAVVDSGVLLDHPDLVDRMWSNAADPVGDLDGNGDPDDDGNGYVDDFRGWDWVRQDDNNPTDENGHGTIVAGIAGARGNNTLGISGVAWDVRIMPLRVLNEEATGTLANIVAGLEYAGDKGAHVVNVSLGISGGSEPQSLHDVIEDHPNSLFVTSAGNDDQNNDAVPSWPCNTPLSNVICVAASDESDVRAVFSNYGADSVHLAAPGTNIWSTTVPGSLASDGTYALADSPDATYGNGVDSWARRDAALDLSGASECHVVYDLSLESELSEDIVRVQASTDGTSWSSKMGWGFSGSTGGEVVQVRPDDPMAPAPRLGAPYEGAATVFIGFRFESGAEVVDDGAVIDNVDVVCTNGDPGMTPESFESGDLTGWTTGGTNDTWGVTDTSYGESHGTSMAAPFVSGAAALVWALRPAEVTKATWARHVRNVIRGGVVAARDWMKGKLAWGGRLNLRRTLTFAGDLDAPTKPKITGADMNDEFQPKRAFDVGWSAIDGGSGVRSHDVRRRVVKFDAKRLGPFPVWRSDTRKDGDDVFGALGSTYCFDTRARDNAFNVSTYGANRCTAIPLNDRQLDRSRAWHKKSGSTYYRGTYLRTTSKGAVLTIDDVKYRTLVLVATTCSDCGKVRVFRGKRRLRTIDLQEPGYNKKQFLTIKRVAGVKGPSRIRIKVISTSKRVMIEGLGVSRF